MNKTRTELGKISRVHFGITENCQFGLSLTFSGKNFSVGATVIGGWAYSHISVGKSRGWTEEDRSLMMITMCERINTILADAKKTDIKDLVGVPVELTTIGSILGDWRILTEVL